MARTSPSTMLKLLKTCHRPARRTLSNAFFESMKLWIRSRWCCRCFSTMTWLSKICSTVLQPGLKPACSSGSSSSALALSHLRTTQSIIWLGWLIMLNQHKKTTASFCTVVRQTTTTKICLHML